MDSCVSVLAPLPWPSPQGEGDQTALAALSVGSLALLPQPYQLGGDGDLRLWIAQTASE
jgi:hypothetical protein